MSRLDLLGAVAEQPLTPGETLSGPGVWVLSVLVAGQLWRWGSEECAPVTDDGDTLLVPGGLEINPEETADILRLTGSETTISADGLFPPEDIAALIEAGHDLDDIPAEVALWYEGRAWEERIVILRGWTAIPDYGTEDEPIALTIESPEYTDGGVLIQVNGRISAVVMPGGDKAQEKAEGRIVPLVIGRPDWVPASVYDNIQDFAAVAQGRVTATTLQVEVLDESATSSVGEAESVALARDNLGRWFARTSYAGSVTVADTNEVITRWNHAATVGGGVENEHRDGYVTGLGDVVRWAMRRSTIPIDEGRWRAIEDHLNRWLVDYWTNDPKLTPWQFVREVLLPLVPVSILQGPRGLYPVWWPYQPGGGAQSGVAEIDVQASGLQRRGRVQFQRNDRPVNEVSIEYYPWQRDQFRYALTYTGVPADDLEVADTFRVSTSVLRSAYVRQGEERRAAEVVQSRAIYQRATAEQTLGWMQYAKCRAMRTVVYDDLRGRWAWLRPGMVVPRLVDDEVGFDRIAWVRQVARSSAAARIQFLLWEHD